MAKCPQCNTLSDRKDGFTKNKITGARVSQKWKCINPQCSRTNFAERSSIPEPEVQSEIKDGAKVLIFDLETSPIKAWTWRTFKAFISPEMIIDDWCILTWAAKWLDNPDIMSDAIIKHNQELDDFEIVSSMWQLLDEADIVVAHNARKFDTKRINTRFLFHGMTPPSPYKVVDTLVIARANFSMTSNKLDYIAKFLEQEGKLEHEGWELWEKCLKNDSEAWQKMLDYNEQDVTELENVYLKLRAWDSRHPSVSVHYLDSDIRCTKCGSVNIEYVKDVYTNTKAFKLYHCQDCRAWSRSRTGEQKKGLLMTQ